MPVSLVKPSSTDCGTYSDQANRLALAAAAGSAAATSPTSPASTRDAKRVMALLPLQGFRRRSASVANTANTVNRTNTVEIAFNDGSRPFFTRPKISSGSVRVRALAVK